MRIDLYPPKGHESNIIMEEDELVGLYNSLQKLLPYIEENQALGFNSAKRIRATELPHLNTLLDKLEQVVTEIAKSKPN